MNELPNVEQSYGIEVARKAIHLCSLSIPIVYYFVSKATALTILIPIAVLFGVSDIARLLHPPFGRLYEKYFGFLLRSHERNDRGRRLNGATYVLLSAALCIWLFPKVIVITAFTILIVSDSFAALIGRKFGKHRFMGKSFEGSSAFFLSALVVVAVAPKINYLPGEYLIGIVAAILGAIVEAMPSIIDDNLTIPISISLVMWLMYDALLPAVNVFGLDRIG